MGGLKIVYSYVFVAHFSIYEVLNCAKKTFYAQLIGFKIILKILLSENRNHTLAIFIFEFSEI